MRKLPTGELCAGEPLAQFGGRGDSILPDPYQQGTASENLFAMAHKFPLSAASGAAKEEVSIIPWNSLPPEN
jgi:hypothetical protein